MPLFRHLSSHPIDAFVWLQTERFFVSQGINALLLID